MRNTHSHWRSLNLNIPVRGVESNWLKGRNYSEISVHVSKVLRGRGGLKGEICGDSVATNGEIIDVAFNYWYEDLADAVTAFEESWEALGFPDAGAMRHTERLPDCTFVMHTLLTRDVGGFSEVFKTLSEANLKRPKQQNKSS